MAKFQMVSNGRDSAFMLDDVGFGSGIERIEFVADSMKDDIEMTIKIQSVRNFKTCDKEEFKKHCERILSDELSAER